MNYTILQGDNRLTLKTLPNDSIDAIITDPPYGIDFLGKSWDANTGALETYQECLRVLKPGGHILAFSAARTYHHLAITLEQAGFEIRDQIMWIYSSGFPKSQDIGKSIQRSLGVKETKANKYHMPRIGGSQEKPVSSDTTVCTDPEAKAWSGWGTALKPAHEPIALARKPMKGSIKDNCLKYGTGALNIDATRVPYDDPAEAEAMADWYEKYPVNQTGGAPVFQGSTVKKTPKAGKRTASFHQATGNPDATQSGGDGSGGWEASNIGRFPSNVIGDIPDYQKYFYCPKVSRKERHIGFELPPPMFGGVQGCYDENGERFAVGFDARAEGKTKKKKHDPLGHIPTNPDGMWDVDGTGVQYNSNKNTNIGNNHPTVKPIELMKYLIKLITPPGGTVLDPFNGSGSTGCAAVELGHPYIGCELDPAYVAIAEKRIEAWYEHTRDPARDIFE